MSAPKIEGYKFGQMVIDGQTHTNDLILLQGRVIPDWWREEGHRLSEADLQEVLDARPEVLVIGTGANGLMEVPPETRQAIEDTGIELKIARTDPAWGIYNNQQQRRDTAGAFHLTC